MSALRLLGRLLVAAAIFFASGELLARGLDLVDRLNGYSRLLFTRGPSLDLPYRLRPGITTTLWGLPIHVNALGLRGPEVAPVPAPGVHRVLMLGDSVVFGQQLAEEDTVARVLERTLAAGGGRWEVLNGGVQGYDTVAEAELLETAGLALGPEQVIVGTCLNDYDVTPQYSPLGFLTRKELDQRAPRLLDRSEFVALLRWAAAYARGTLGAQLLARGEARRGAPAPLTSEQVQAFEAKIVRDAHLAFYHAPVPVYWKRLRAGFLALGRASAKHGVGLLIAIFPEGYQVGVPDPDLEPQRRLLALCEETAVRCLDLQPAFARAGGELFFDLQHPNARGHAVAAAAIAAALSRVDGPGSGS